MGNCQNAKKHQLNQDIWTNIFLPELLALSGDIHPNPGPSKCQKINSKNGNKTHIIEIFTVFIIIISQIQQIQQDATESNKKSNNLKVYY